jgi:hypothetical protein
VGVAGSVSVAELLDGHVGLEVECLDRIYLNAYVPGLQVGGQVVTFLTQHLGQPIPSPALFARIGNRFRGQVARLATRQGIPLLRFGRHDRKIDKVRPLLHAAEQVGRPGVVAIGVAQEFQNVFTASKRRSDPGRAVQFTFRKEDRRVTCFYFYLWDEDFGPGFIKLCAYFPYPGKVWVNGHEWAKQQARKQGLGFTALSNGFATCEQPEQLQRICDRLGPADIQAFLARWLAVLPTPLDATDHAAGYWWELSMRQVEVSRTLVFDAPRRARGFFEAVVRDNLGVGRPEEVELTFTGRRTPRGRPRTRPETFRTRVVTTGLQVTVNVFYKHSRIKQYLKDGRALRIETVVNTPDDLGVQRRLVNLPQLQHKAREANRRILAVQRAGQGCAIRTATFERLQQPYVREGQRTGALRFGDHRAMALAGALCLTLAAVTGVTNRSLRALVAGLLGSTYSASQMSYDLRRLRLHGLIRRIHRQHRYVLTDDGQRFAVFYTKLGDRVLPALFAADQSNSPPQLRHALRVIGSCVDDYLTDAGLAAAA